MDMLKKQLWFCTKCVILQRVCKFTQFIKCLVLHTMCNFSHRVKFFTHKYICEFELPNVSLRSFVARQLLSCIYARSSVKFSGLNLWLCKKSDKYEVWKYKANNKYKSTNTTEMYFTAQGSVDKHSMDINWKS